MPIHVRLFLSGLVLCALSCSLVFAANVEDIPPCDSPSCDRVAQTIPWENAHANPDGQTVRIGRFSFVIPTGAEVRLSGDLTFFHYSDKPRRWLSVRLNSIQDVDLTEADLGDLRFADAVRILFTKTRQDKEPSNLHARNMWRSLLHAKSLHIAENTPVYFSHRGDAEVAFGQWEDGRRFVFIANKHTSHAYVQIEGTGFSDAEMKGFAFQN